MVRPARTIDAQCGRCRLIPLTLISGVVAGIVGFGLAWQLQAGRIANIHLEAANERISLQRASRAIIERNMSQVSKAQANTASRVIAMRVDSAAADSELDSLRDQSAATLRAATDNAAACLADAVAKSELLNQCAGSYAGLAATADGHVSDIKTMIDSWPR